MSYNKILTDKQNEIINENAIREAGKFLITMLVTRHAPFYCAVSEKQEECTTIPMVTSIDLVHENLIQWAGEAALEIYGQDVRKNLRHKVGSEMKCHFQNDELDFYEKCFETDVTMLKMCKSLLFVLATELKWSREMNYQEICNFCKSHEKICPLLLTIKFNEFPEFSRKELKRHVHEFKEWCKQA